MQRRHFCLGALFASLGFNTTARATPASYPSRAVRIIVPYAAGGGPDVMMRQFGPKLSAVLEQPVVVENKVGAGGVLAAQYVAQADADGYTALLGSNSHLIQKALQPDLAFDPLNDFLPVTVIATSPTVLVVSASSPYKTLQDLISALRANPGKLNFASGGVGSGAHLGGATFLSLLHANAVHIPFKGSVEIPVSLTRGDTDFAFAIAGTAIPQVEDGRLRALAVSSRDPMPQLPNVPTLHGILHSELAIQEFWFGFWLPQGSPPEAVNKLFAATTTALQDPSVKRKFAAAGTRVIQSDNPQSFASFIQSEYRKWAEIIKLTGVTAG
ncbi:tripartite tricarboxylate transporter substrate binding protein [Allopusillimonas soli]|uniref:Tripartite tricarboxylate transporter substrate binding protein n=1 Tax=Allopusillimonas soli TaxID=659016 RepID=A0A853FFG2_9BURK|nr:tripartite tricarboxylate transporter substrate binding protein [Allopusillimonas soli]NYT38609.1 tripartite tricarboxylate transporter substrate binding protein [Allopusillimonas soli]TEA71678.1 tripartite tricarboxylate transporter substrate binding protein [Allopusillimonas soli]